MSDTSSSDNDLSENEGSIPLKDKVKKFMNEKPVYNKSSKSIKKNASLRAKLEKYKSTSKPGRTSARVDNRKELEDHFRGLATDFTNLNKKFDLVLECLSETFDRLDSLEARMEELEKRQSENPSPQPTFSQVVAQPLDSERIDKLEFKASEEERHNRSLEVTLTHPDINGNTPAAELNTHVTSFLTEHMGMEIRERDPNFTIKKGFRDNTVHIKFSDKRYKKFLFAARKRLRQNHPANCENLYVNEILTSYNFGILKSLKAEKKRRTENGETCFHTVYSFEGKIYVKKLPTNESSLCIASKRDLRKLLSQLNGNSTD